MSKGLNRVLIMGNLTRDPEARTLSSGGTVVNMTVAVNFRYKAKSGLYEDGVDFIPVTVWGTMGDNCVKYLSKGSSVLVEGKLQVRSYEDKEGNKRTATTVSASDITFIGGRTDNRGSSEGDDGYDDYPPF